MLATNQKVLFLLELGGLSEYGEYALVRAFN